jgi:catechol 1,2-dioxygenase
MRIVVSGATALPCTEDSWFGETQEIFMNSDSAPICGLSFHRRMFLRGIASLFGGVVAPGAFASCQLTERDIIGPFYRFGAPFQTKLAGPDEPGERLIMTGTVYSSDCRSRYPTR